LNKVIFVSGIRRDVQSTQTANEKSR